MLKDIIMHKRIRKALLLIILIGGGCIFISSADTEFKILKSIDIYINLFKEVNASYVDTIDPEDFTKKGIDGMLESLDPYTTYIPESEMDDFKFLTTGQYGGIGALIRKEGEFSVIAEPYEGFPAMKSGIRAGDIVLEINGKSIKGLNVSKVSELLKGSPGTDVILTIQRYGQEELLKFSVIREKITIPNVPYYGAMKDSIGYIRLSNFTSDAAKEVKEALQELKTKNGIHSLILDLRNNPGGLLIEAVRIVNLFVPKDIEVVATKGKVKQWNSSYKTTDSPYDLKIPLVILVNRGSASASEIVAGAIQDLDRGVVIGQRTFGKGLVQTTRPLSYNAQLKVTTAKYYIPSGRCIQALDYSHKKANGAVESIPDSLIRAFKTKGGRTVYDGGGIKPDVVLPVDSFGTFTANLYAKNVFFDFTSRFLSANKSIETVEKFEITEGIYQQFIDFVKEKKFDYQSESEKIYEKLVAKAKEERYFDGNEKQFDVLKSAISHSVEKDLQTFKPEISQLLREEIGAAYYFQKGRILSSFKTDKELQHSLNLLANKKEIDLLLRTAQ